MDMDHPAWLLSSSYCFRMAILFTSSFLANGFMNMNIKIFSRCSEKGKKQTGF